MSRREKREQKQGNKTFRKILIVAVFLMAIVYVLKYAYNYVQEDVYDRTNLIINSSNVTKSLKNDIFIENNVIYISKEDISNFFDSYIYYDQKYNQIITGSDSKIATIAIGENKMTNNGSLVNIPATVIEKNNTYYIPFSALKDIYNIKINYIEKNDIVIVDSLSKKMVVADSIKQNSVKQERTNISRTVDKLEKGENVTIIPESSKNGWIRVRTDNGKLGYVKEDTITNKTTIRENMVKQKQIEGKISMIWEYFSEYGTAPSRTGSLKGVNCVSPTFFTLKKSGKGEIEENVGDQGKSYIEWAHDQGYKVWPSISNNAMIETTSEIMNDSKLRQDLIDKIVSLVVKYKLDGINIDFEYMKVADKDLFSRFIIELEPRLNDIGAILSVDVTAPDGGEEWSMCYDRHMIGKVADYIVFMAYDQNGSYSAKEGTTAGCDWIEVNLDKFVGTQEEIESEKIILGIPFYTRVWYTNSKGEKVSEAIEMKDLNTIIPNNANKIWDEDLKQYIAEYTKNGVSYKVWVEDEKSIQEKLNLIKKYNLAGAAYWKKGGEQDSIWSIVTNILGVN